MNDFAERPKYSRSPVFIWSAVSFVAFLLVAYFTGAAWPFIPAIASWLVGYFFDRRVNKTFANETARFREENAQTHPAVFAEQPPQSLDSIHGDFVDMHDLETGLFIGRGLKRDIQTLYDAFDNDPHVFENGPNDIPLTQDFIEQVQESENFELTPHFLDLMNNAMDEKYLTLVTIRWVAPKNAG